MLDEFILWNQTTGMLPGRLKRGNPVIHCMEHVLLFVVPLTSLVAAVLIFHSLNTEP